MRRVLRHWRRLLLAVFLLGLGTVLYQRLPPAERWSVRLDEDALKLECSFSRDGKFVFSHPMVQQLSGPFRKWDAASGALLATASSKEQSYQSHSLEEAFLDNPSTRQRFWGGLPLKQTDVLELFDLESGRETRLAIKPFPEKPFLENRKLVLSPTEDMAAVFHFRDIFNQMKGEVYLYGLPSGKQVAALPVTWPAPMPLAFEIGRFAPDGAYFVFRSRDPDLSLWDIRKGKLAGVLPGAGLIRGFSPDARFLLTKIAAESEKTTLWDLSELNKPRAVASVRGSQMWDDLHFTPDSRTLIEIGRGEKAMVVFWDCVTGKEKSRLSIPGDFFDPLHCHVAFSSDGRLLGMDTRFKRKARTFLAVMNVETRELLWSQETDYSWLIFSGSETLVLGQESSFGYDAQLLHAQTGRLLASFPMPFRHPNFAANGRHVFFHGFGKPDNQAQSWFFELLRKWLPSSDSVPDLVRVIDVPTLREVFHLADSHVAHAQLSPDGTTLLTMHDGPAGPHLRCWDIPGRHPWLKIVGIPAAIGVVLLLLGKWRQVRKARKARLATLPAQSPL